MIHRSEKELARAKLTVLRLYWDYHSEVTKDDKKAVKAFLDYEAGQAEYDQRFADGWMPSVPPLSRANERIMDAVNDWYHRGGDLETMVREASE
jgi:hypothetical protein